MKKQSGVSLFEVIISIIILLIIAFFAIFNSINSVAQAKATEVYSEMKSVEAAVEFVKSQLETRDGFILEYQKHYDSPKPDDENETETISSDTDVIIYGFLEHSSEEAQAAKYLGINGLKRDYVVNYTTGKFELSEAVDVQGTKVKTLDEVNSLLNSGIK